MKNTKSIKLISLFVLVSLVSTLLCTSVFASTGETAAAAAAVATAGTGIGAGLGLIAAAAVTGMAAIGAGIAVASAAPAAIGAFSEDPKAFGKALIFVALGEGVALYGLLISILILNKI